MLSVIDTIRALSEMIEAKYPNYPVVDMDTDEDYPRPSYFIDVENIDTSFVATDYIKESSTIKIVFFTAERYEGFLELLDMKNQLLAMFDNPLYIHDDTTEYYVTLHDTDSMLYKADKVLEFTLHADLIQKVERKEIDRYMENLDVNITR